MPGGFTWVDALAGFQASGQTFLTVAAFATAIVLVVVGLYALGKRRRDAIREWLAVGDPPRPAVRAHAREHLYRGETRVDDWGADDIYPEREAS